jgi:hypothetical protein
MKFSNLLLVIFICIGLPYTQERLSGERDPWLWPFSETSIWNMPIGSNAQFVNADITTPASRAGADIVHLYKLNPSDPMTPVQGSQWAHRCDVNTSLGYSLPFPTNWIIKDTHSSSIYGNTPNSTFAFLDVNGVNLIQGQTLARCYAGGPIHIPNWTDNRQTLKGDGLQYGMGSGASQLSGLGGTIRKGEMTSADPIRHVLKLLMWSERFFAYGKGGACDKGWRWPAKSADNYAHGTYHGSNTEVCMGTLVAIPSNVSEGSLGLQSEPAKKIFWTLQNYGAYIVEDSFWDFNGFLMEEGVENEWSEFNMSTGTWKNDVNKLFAALKVVKNNSPSSIGGGGILKQPLAPVFVGEGSGASSGTFSSSSELVSSSSNFTGKIEAESADEYSGLVPVGQVVKYSAPDAWAKYSHIDFGSGYNSVEIRFSVPDSDAGNLIVLRTGSIAGPIIGELKTTGTGGWDSFNTLRILLNGPIGVEDLYLTFKQDGGIQSWVADIDYFNFSPEQPTSVTNSSYRHTDFKKYSVNGVSRWINTPEGNYLINGEKLRTTH